MKKIAAIGEVLWDLFPEGAKLGGAPANFVWHCHALGLEAYLVSKVGDDELGRKVIDDFQSRGLSTDYIGRSSCPTGQVKVHLDENGKPDYEIVEGVAWDDLDVDSAVLKLAAEADAIYLGSLSQRNPKSREAVQAFAQAATNAVKILDVNLRQAFFSKEILLGSLDLATVAKISDEELPVIADMAGISGTVNDQLKGLLEKYELDLIAYTRGPDGSLLLGRDSESDFPGTADKPVNTVGAGDSFTATLCTGLLRGLSLDQINEWANSVAGFVCTQDGATPVLPPELVNKY